MSAALVAMAGAAFQAEAAARRRRRGLDEAGRRAGGWALILAAVGIYAFVMHRVFG